MDKNFYNEASASKLGWDPSWFGEKYFDDRLMVILPILIGTRLFFGRNLMV